MSKYQFENKDLLIVTFDDAITTLDIIVNELKKGGKPISGEPIYLKSN